MSGLFARERIARLRSKQDTYFWSIVFARPLAILLLVLVADVRLVTPNLLTLISAASQLAAAALVWPAAWGGADLDPVLRTWLAVGLLQAALVLDCMDGALARYRGTTSNFGSFLDKITDRIGILALLPALGLAAYEITGELRYVLLGGVLPAVSGLSGYAKWLAGVHILAATGDRSAFADPDIVPPPERRLCDWARYLLGHSWRLLRVSEIDLPLWASVALVLQLCRPGGIDWLPWVLWYIAAWFLVTTVERVIHRGRSVARLDRRG